MKIIPKCGKLPIPFIHWNCIVDSSEYPIVKLPWSDIVPSFGKWINRYKLSELPCYNILALDGKHNIDITTSWPSEITHKIVKIFDFHKWRPRVDIFVRLSIDIAIECDSVLLYETKIKAQQQRRAITDSSWSKHKVDAYVVGLLNRYNKLKTYVSSKNYKEITWTRL